MPNWVHSGFTVTGIPSEIARFRATMFRRLRLERDGFHGRVGEIATIFDFNAILPMPRTAMDGDYEGWAAEHWGTKWNAFGLHVRPGTPAEFGFQFETAWDFPWPVFEALAEAFPDLVFDGSCYEEDGAFEYAGQFNGLDDFGPAELEFIVISIDDGQQPEEGASS